MLQVHQSMTKYRPEWDKFVTADAIRPHEQLFDVMNRILSSTTVIWTKRKRNLKTKVMMISMS